MTDANPFPIRQVVGQFAVSRVNSIRRVVAITANKISVSTREPIVSTESLIFMGDFPELANHGNRPCAEAVHVAVEENRFHPAWSSNWRDGYARRGCSPIAHPARLHVGAGWVDSQCGSLALGVSEHCSGFSFRRNGSARRVGEPVARIRHRRLLPPLNITGQWARQGDKQDCTARQYRRPGKGSLRLTSAVTGARGRRQRQGGATISYLPLTTNLTSSKSRRVT